MRVHIIPKKMSYAPTWSSTTFSGSSAMRGGTCVSHRTSSSRMAFSGASAEIVRFNSINDFDKLISLWLHVGRGSDKNTHFFDLSWHRRGYPKALASYPDSRLKSQSKRGSLEWGTPEHPGRWSSLVGPIVRYHHGNGSRLPLGLLKSNCNPSRRV